MPNKKEFRFKARLLNDSIYTVIGRYSDNEQTYVQTITAAGNNAARDKARRMGRDTGFEVLFVLEGTIGRVIDEPFADGTS